MSWTGVLWPTAALLPRLATGAGPQPGMHRWARRLLPALGVDLVVEGHPRLDIPLWVANHLSWVDPVVLMSLRPMGTIAKGEVTGYPLIGRWAKKSGIHFVDREDATSRAAALASFATSLQNGRDMLLFPEGTTTRGERLAAFYKGGLQAAFDLGLPAQPMRISSAIGSHDCAKEVSGLGKWFHKTCSGTFASGVNKSTRPWPVTRMPSPAFINVS